MKFNLFISLFLGVVTFAYGKFIIVPQCSDLTAQDNFQPDKYFNGRWYLTNLNTSSERSEVCQESNSKVLADGTIEHNISAYSEVLKPEFAEFRCKANVKDIKSGNGRVVFDCEIIRGVELGKFKLDGTIVETDYDNFAVFYACSTNDGKRFGHALLVLSRNHDEPTDSRVAQTIKKLGFDLEKFSSRKDATCKIDPNFNN